MGLAQVVVIRCLNGMITSGFTVIGLGYSRPLFVSSLYSQIGFFLFSFVAVRDVESEKLSSFDWSESSYRC